MVDVPAWMLARTKGDEGFRARPYLDTNGYWIAGYGMNLGTTSMAEPAAALQLATDLAEYLAALDYVWAPAAALDDVRKGVLAMIAFNLGWAGLMNFRKMLAALAVQDWNEAGRQVLDSLAANQAPRRYRRFAAMLVEGRPAPEGKLQANLWAASILRSIDVV